MPRRKRNRRIQIPPQIKGMSVYGLRGQRITEKIILCLEEYEAIRLLDYQNLTQEEAAGYMNVSRPTLTRIYDEARKKVATAFVEGRDLKVSGGDVYFDENWYKCRVCKASFSDYSEGEIRCPVCGADNPVLLNEYLKS